MATIEFGLFDWIDRRQAPIGQLWCTCYRYTRRSG
jgi:hypothetical protein